MSIKRLRELGLGAALLFGSGAQAEAADTHHAPAPGEDAPAAQVEKEESVVLSWDGKSDLAPEDILKIREKASDGNLTFKIFPTKPVVEGDRLKKSDSLVELMACLQAANIDPKSINIEASSPNWKTEEISGAELNESIKNRAEEIRAELEKNVGEIEGMLSENPNFELWSGFDLVELDSEGELSPGVYVVDCYPSEEAVKEELIVYAINSLDKQGFRNDVTVDPYAIALRANAKPDDLLILTYDEEGAPSWQPVVENSLVLTPQDDRQFIISLASGEGKIKGAELVEDILKEFSWNQFSLNEDPGKLLDMRAQANPLEGTAYKIEITVEPSFDEKGRPTSSRAESIMQLKAALMAAGVNSLNNVSIKAPRTYHWLPESDEITEADIEAKAESIREGWQGQIDWVKAVLRGDEKANKRLGEGISLDVKRGEAPLYPGMVLVDYFASRDSLSNSDASVTIYPLGVSPAIPPLLDPNLSPGSIQKLRANNSQESYSSIVGISGNTLVLTVNERGKDSVVLSSELPFTLDWNVSAGKLFVRLGQEPGYESLDQHRARERAGQKPHSPFSASPRGFSDPDWEPLGASNKED